MFFLLFIFIIFLTFFYEAVEKVPQKEVQNKKEIIIAGQQQDVKLKDYLKKCEKGDIDETRAGFCFQIKITKERCFEKIGSESKKDDLEKCIKDRITKIENLVK